MAVGRFVYDVRGTTRTGGILLGLVLYIFVLVLLLILVLELLL